MNPGTFTVRLTVSNGTGLSTLTQTDYIAVNPVNQAPVAVANRYTIKKNTVLTVLPKGVLTNDKDPDGDALSAILVTDPVHGTVELKNDGSFVYIPSNEFIGTDSFTYKANDGLTDSNTVTVTLTVKQSNKT